MTPDKQKEGTASRLSQTMPCGLLTTEQAAAWLGYTPRFLEAKRLRGGGPDFIRVSWRSVRYRLNDLEVWASSRLATSTSYPEPGGKS